MARRNNNLILLVLVVLVIVGLICMWNRNAYGSETYSTPKQLHEPNDIEFVDRADILDDFQLLGVADEEPAHQLQLGMGPGLYGSGRHTSEMVGN